MVGHEILDLGIMVRVHARQPILKWKGQNGMINIRAVGDDYFDYDEKQSLFFVHSGGYRICDTEDSEVADAICKAFNREHAITTAEKDGVPLEMLWRGYAVALRALDARRTTSDVVTIAEANTYDKCASELAAALSAHKPGELQEVQAWNVLWMDGGTQCHRIFSNEHDAFEWAACLPIKFPGCSNGEVVELVPRQ